MGGWQRRLEIAQAASFDEHERLRSPLESGPQGVALVRREDAKVVALQVEGQRIPRTLDHWQKDSDLAGIRDAAALAKLPAAEQKAFAQLWADVAALLKNAEQGVKAGA